MGVGMIGVLTGAVLSAFTLVHAAIPDSDGTIHGCRNSTTTLLRIIDASSASCDSNETALNWDQHGIRGYARITTTGSNTYAFDSNRTLNLSNLHVSNLGFNDNLICMTVTGTPKSISFAPETGNNEIYAAAFKDSNGWTASFASSCTTIDSTTNVAVTVPNSSFLLTVY